MPPNCHKHNSMGESCRNPGWKLALNRFKTTIARTLLRSLLTKANFTAAVSVQPIDLGNCTVILVYVIVYTCIRTYVQTYIHTYMPTTDRQTDIPTYLPTYVRTHTYIHTCMHAYIHMCISMKPRDAMQWNLKPLDHWTRLDLAGATTNSLRSSGISTSVHPALFMPQSRASPVSPQQQNPFQRLQQRPFLTCFNLFCVNMSFSRAI